MNNDDLYLEQILIGPMENFIYLIGSKRTREVALIDPAWDVDGFAESYSCKRSQTFMRSGNSLSSRSCRWKYGRTLN